MALIYEGSRCALCDQPIDASGDFFSTSGVFFESGHRLFRYCDAPMHWDCYGPWADRREFARAYVRAKMCSEEVNVHWARVFENEHCFVQINPDRAVAEASVCLFETGSEIRIELSDWKQWLGSDLSDYHPCERSALAYVKGQLAERFLGEKSLIDQIDWERQHKKKALREERAERQREEARAQLAANHLASRKLAVAMRRDGFQCPNCHETSKNFKYHDNRPDAASYFVCALCSQSYTPG